MKAYLALLVVLALVVTGCGPLSVTEVVVDTENEILYNDVVNSEIPADEISYFGVEFGASEEDIVSLHGQPDSEQEFAFGRTKNMEYAFGDSNKTSVLYHLERGTLTAVLLVRDSSFTYDSLLGDERSLMYSTLGLPTVSQDLERERLFVYDPLGYEVFTRAGNVHRIYFTTPNRGIQPAGKDADLTNNTAPIFCAQVITIAQSNDECAQFPTPCDVPQGWEVIDNPTQEQWQTCEFRAE